MISASSRRGMMDNIPLKISENVPLADAINHGALVFEIDSTQIEPPGSTQWEYDNGTLRRGELSRLEHQRGI